MSTGACMMDASLQKDPECLPRTQEEGPGNSHQGTHRKKTEGSKIYSDMELAESFDLENGGGANYNACVSVWTCHGLFYNHKEEYWSRN